jgi:phosphate-selective porin OprO/OprP
VELYPVKHFASVSSFVSAISVVLLAAPAAAQPAPAEPPAPVPAPAPAPAPPAPEAAATVTQQGEGKPAKQLDLKPGGYIHSDARTFVGDAGGPRDITIRRLRFKLDGSAYKRFNIRTLIDFAGSRLVVNDAWGELALAPELTLRFGKDKGQFGLERLVSASQLTFIERSFPTQLSPNRDIGLAARGDLAGGVVHYSIAAVDGVHDNSVMESDTDDELEYNVHLLISPFRRGLARLGDLAIGGATTFGRAAGTQANPGLVPLKSGGQATIVRYTTGMDDASTARVDGWRYRLAAHGYYYGGPVGVLAEYVRNQQTATLMGSGARLTNQAWQVAANVAVTPGDRPTYRSIKPKRPFDPAAGTWGAVELALRYAELRIDPDTFAKGFASPATSIERARAVTLGGNWYFNEYLKLQLDYEGTVFRGGAPDGGDRATEHVIATRLQAAI